MRLNWISSWVTLLGLLILVSAASCNEKKGDKKQEDQSATVTSPFSADNAYRHIEKQLAFGPRVPNTEAHKATAQYFVAELESLDIPVIKQEMELEAYDGTKLEAINIIATYNPHAERRMMLFAHWDTRPIADYDPNPSLKNDPIPGADDGASGPSVILEIARLLKEEGLQNVGIDLILFDAEDYGLPVWENSSDTNSEDTWALGTQYWTHNLHVANYNPQFGILLDMVGAKDAIFMREYFSQQSAGKYVTQIWIAAEKLGHSGYFINKMGGAVTDDHYFVIQNLRIPCVDIINYDPKRPKGFGDYWHTHADNLDNISKETLRAVGETVWQVILDFDQALF